MTACSDPYSTTTDSPPHRVLIVFAKVPEPGRVKTRLADTLGPERAAEIYHAMGRGIVDGVRNGDWTTMVCHAPDDGGSAMREWLGDDGLQFTPQGPGDLGARMDRAFRHAFAKSNAEMTVCLIGTDAPDLTAPLVAEAFDRLEIGADVVLGPALDGGYYLVGLSSPAPTLFEDISWSTPEVLATTRLRIREAGLRSSELRTLRDVDEVEDLPDDYR